MRIKAVIILVVTLLAVSFLAVCKKDSPTSPSPPSPPPPSSGSKVGDTAADFSAKDQNGNNVTLYQYSGKVILIDFSADWCGPCRDEAGHLEALFQNYKNRGFEIITLLISGSPADWANQYKLTFPVLGDNNETLWSIYGEGYVPLNIILDRRMIIRYKQAGYNESSIISEIEKYL